MKTWCLYKPKLHRFRYRIYTVLFFYCFNVKLPTQSGLKTGFHLWLTDIDCSLVILFSLHVCHAQVLVPCIGVCRGVRSWCWAVAESCWGHFQQNACVGAHEKRGDDMAGKCGREGAMAAGIKTGNINWCGTEAQETWGLVPDQYLPFLKICSMVILYTSKCLNYYLSMEIPEDSAKEG